MQDLLELYQQSETARRLADLHEQIQPTLEELVRILGHERAFVVLVDQVAGIVQGAVGIETPEALIEALSVATDEQDPILQSLRIGRPLRIEDALRDSRIPESERGYFARFGLTTFATVPLPPASSVLVVSGRTPITEAQVNELLPFAGQIIAAVSRRGEAKRQHDNGEQQAAESEWLWWMVNSVQDPIVLSDEHNNIVLQNVHAERLLTSRPDDSAGRRRAVELNNFLLSAALSSFTLDQGRALGRDLTLVDPIEGAEILFEVICRPATNLRTGQRGLTSVLKDVTDLRRAMEEVRHSLDELQRTGEHARQERDRLNLILAYVADPIVVTDPSGAIILMNQPAEKLLQSIDRSTSEPAATVYLSNDAKLSSFLSQLGLEGTDVRSGEIPLTDPSTGEPLTMSVTATEVRDALGQVTAVVSVLHDLTRIRELEQRRVEQELFESQKLAAEGRLAAAVAHEINNPLEAIKNSLYLLVSRTPEDDPNRQFLEIANNETRRVSEIIRQMLGFYRPKADKVPVDANRILDEALTLLERQLRQHHVNVARDFAPDLPSILASADQLKQVFLNLFLNAQEAMPSGGNLRIATRLSRETDTGFLITGRYILIFVQDWGMGIIEEDLRHIFEPFYSTKQKQRGSGLGLWVSLGIIQQHGGQMKVRSRPGHGTTFTIALPIGEANV